MYSTRFILFITLVFAFTCFVYAESTTTTTRRRKGSNRYSKKSSYNNYRKSITTTKKSTSTKKAPVTKAAAQSSSSSSGSYSGDGTYYQPGLGSCGWTNSDSDMIVAVNHIQMANGANSNHNPNCGRTIKVKGPKGSVTVKVVDTCPGCGSGALDLSPAAFEKIADLSAGRVPISWSYAN